MNTIPLILSIEEKEAQDFLNGCQKTQEAVREKVYNAIQNHLETRDVDFYSLMAKRWAKQQN